MSDQLGDRRRVESDIEEHQRGAPIERRRHRWNDHDNNSMQKILLEKLESLQKRVEELESEKRRLFGLAEVSGLPSGSAEEGGQSERIKKLPLRMQGDDSRSGSLLNHERSNGPDQPQLTPSQKRWRRSSQDDSGTHREPIWPT